MPFDSEVPSGLLRWLFFITALQISLTVISISVVGALSLARMNISRAPCGFATAPQPTESFPLPQFPYQLLLAVQVMRLFPTLSISLSFKAAGKAFKPVFSCTHIQKFVPSYCHAAAEMIILYSATFNEITCPSLQGLLICVLLEM